MTGLLLKTKPPDGFSGLSQIPNAMKTNVAVFFGGRSVEHEISVISALQAINAFDKDKYNIIPIYISKAGRWYTGDNLLEIRNYRNLDKVTAEAEEVFMRPEYGDFNLYKVNTGLFARKNPVVAELHLAIPVLHGTNGEDGVFEGLLETIGIDRKSTRLNSSHWS